MNKHMTPATKVNGVMCPYADKECPKLEVVNETVNENSTRLLNIERVLYIIVGLLAINSGLIIW